MTETSKNQKVNSYKIAQVMFETFNIFGLYINFIRKLSIANSIYYFHLWNKLLFKRNNMSI